MARVLLLALNVGRLTGPLKALSCLVGVELLPLLLLDPSVGAEEDAHEEDREGGASTLRISHRGLCPDTCKPCSQQFSFELAEDAVMLYAVSDAVFLGLPMLAIQLAFLFYNHDQIHNPILLTSIGFSAFSAAFLTHVDVDVSESSSVLGKMFAVLFFTSHLGIKLLSWILLSQTIGYLLIFLLLVDWAISVVAVLLAWKYATPGGAVFSASVMGKALLYGVLNVFLFQPFSGQYTGPGLTAPARYRFTRVTTRGGKSKVRKRKVASPVKLPKKRSVDTSTSATGSSSLADSLPQSAERHIFAVDARSWWIVLKHILVNGLMTLLVLGTYRTPASANQQVHSYNYPPWEAGASIIAHLPCRSFSLFIGPHGHNSIQRSLNHNAESLRGLYPFHPGLEMVFRSTVVPLLSSAFIFAIHILFLQCTDRRGRGGRVC